MQRRRAAIAVPMAALMAAIGAPLPSIIAACGFAVYAITLLTIHSVKPIRRPAALFLGFVDAVFFGFLLYLVGPSIIASVFVFSFLITVQLGMIPLLSVWYNAFWTLWTGLCIVAVGLITMTDLRIVITAVGILTLFGMSNIGLMSIQRRAFRETIQYFRHIKAKREQFTQKTQERADFLAHMNHELRTPLNGILGMTNLLMDSPLPEEQREYARTIRTSSELLLAMINDILDMSRIDSGYLVFERKPFDPIQVISLVIDNLLPAAGDKGVSIESVLKRKFPRTLLGDAARLSQILFNLIGNAVKFTAKGKVTVRVSFENESRARTGLRVDVADTGIGIPPEALPHIFEKYRQASAEIQKRYGGTGLGLAITRELVTRLGGTITAESRIGKGSIFRVFIPYSVPDGPQDYYEPRSFFRKNEQTLMSPPQEDEARGSLDDQEFEGTILVADDNAVNLQLLCRMIHRLGYESQQAEDGIQALAAIQSADRGRLRLAILDYQMPGMTGGEVLSAIRADEVSTGIASIPILVLSGHGVHHLATLAQEFPGVEILEKPIRMHQLQEAITRALKQRNDDSAP